MKTILIRVLLMILIPTTLTYVAFTNSNYEIPYEDYHVKDQHVIITEEMTRIVMRQTTGLDSIKQSQSAFNNLIFNNLRETENPSYNPSPTCDNPLCDYIIILDMPDDGEDAKVGIRGIWGVFEEEELTLFIAFKGSYGVPIDTVIEIRFDVDDSPQELQLRFQGARLGRTPIPPFLLNMIISSAFAAVGEETHATFGSALEVNAPRLEFTLDKAILVQSASSYPHIQQLFLDNTTPYPIWVFMIWLALEL